MKFIVRFPEDSHFMFAILSNNTFPKVVSNPASSIQYQFSHNISIFTFNMCPMSRDFTCTVYRQLITVLKEQKYTFQTFAHFLKNPAPKAIILRHDVDARKLNSLHTARLEADLGIVGTYNFRIVPQSFNESVIQKIAAMGHEIGYHYEDLALSHGDIAKAISLFEQHLSKLRQLVPVETICMHGSPLSRFDNRKIWDKYNYRDYGIIGEPYFDIDFIRVLYLTDTGRRWDGERVSVRDKVGIEQETSFHSTYDIIQAAQKGLLPTQIMINVHPQRWDDRTFPWMRELVMQNVKNVAKRLLAG